MLASVITGECRNLDFRPSFELIIDSYEQVRERPGDNKEQEKYFSGKASKHTFKTQIIILPDARDIVDVIAGEPGPKSDISRCFPSGS
ncbi:MAG: transposase family protein [Nostoc sp.]|uniref:transposase family protein n=1 Tax=Nostoc sp. TaxID=1180 RepID=UPI002FEF1184